MKLKEALDIMSPPKGFRVSFEKRERGMLVSDFFPDKDEEPIATEERAWHLAREFAQKTNSSYVNIYIIEAHNFCPVDGYSSKILKEYPKE